MELVTPRLVLRPFQPADEAALAREADDRRVWRSLRDRFPHPYGIDDARAWIAACAERQPPESLAVTRRGNPAVIGGVGLERHGDVTRFTAELGYWLGAAHWGAGLASEAVAAFTGYAFATFDIERLEAWVFADNAASSRVLAKCGFLHEGTARRSVFKDGRFRDSQLWSRLRGDSAAPAGRAGSSPEP